MRSNSSDPVVASVLASQYQLPNVSDALASLRSAAFCRTASSARCAQRASTIAGAKASSDSKILLSVAVGAIARGDHADGRVRR